MQQNKNNPGSTEDLVRRTTIKNANDLAKEAGHADAGSFISDTARRMRSTNSVERMSAERAAGDFTSKLALLTLYQTIQHEYNLQPYNWINNFEIQKIEAGNSHQFQRTIITGLDNYNEGHFVPQTATTPQIDVANISFYKTNTTSSAEAALSTYARKWLKPLTIYRDQWVPWFLSGKLQEFISKITDNIRSAVELAKFSLIQSMISKLKTGTGGTSQQGMLKIINNPEGVTNILDVFAKVVYPNIKKMKFLNNEFNIGVLQDNANTLTSTSLNSSTKDDLMLLINTETLSKLKTALSSRYNYKMADLSDYINEGNIIECSNEITVGASSAATSVNTNNKLIGENEIMVINKNVIKGLMFVDQQESQAWAQNMTLQLTYHLWLAYGFIPWGQGFVVKSDKFSIIPNA